MLDCDELALNIADKFYSAALGAESWYSALEAFAAATGSRTGELIAIAPNAMVPINLMTNMDPAINADFTAVRGGDPAFNPRVRAGMNAPILKALAENDFITPEEHKVHRHYVEFARPWDIPYICLSSLDRRHGMLVGLAVCRSEREGHISNPERDVFTKLAPHIRAAVRMHMALEEQSALLLSGLFEALSLPVFLCGRHGRVRAMTPAAEQLANRGHTLQLRGGQLVAAHDDDGKTLAAAIEAAATSGNVARRLPRTLIVRSNDPASPAQLVDVIRLPIRSLEFSLHAQVLVIPQGTGGAEERRRILLQSVYKLTAAEIAVAMQLSQGSTAESIAATRGVAIATVRAQIKGILAKFGLRSQVELVGRLSQL
jgi:DNA-binding CsgD family transcriptional regulator